MHRVFGAVLSVALIGASLWPLFPDPPRDSFPFSNYPMFARKKGNPIVHRVVAYDVAGNRVTISPEMIANDEVMQASRTVYHAIRKGRPAAKRLCKETATRVGRTPEFQQVVRLEVISDRFDAVGYFSGNQTPIRSWHHAVCEVRP